MQRQAVADGTIDESHVAGAGISVYVFVYNGKEWMYEHGKKLVKEAASEAGAYGHAPDGRLIKLGPDKYGLLFEGGDMHQGYTNDYAFIISISESSIATKAAMTIPALTL